MSNLVPYTTISAICANRDAALATMQEAVSLIERGHQMAHKAQELARQAHEGASFYLNDRSKKGAYERLFVAFNPEASAEVYRQDVDARIWMNLVKKTGMEQMMDRTARDELYDQLGNLVPEVSEENVQAVFEKLAGDARLIFRRGLARAFSDLDRRFRSHDGFKIGSRIILTNVFNEWGDWNFHSRMRETIQDIERIFSVLDGVDLPVGSTEKAISESRSGWTPQQSVVETSYFKIRTFKNGNAHIWFTRDDLVEKANLELAAYYGEVLGDAVPKGDNPADLKSKAGLPARNLSFYPTPDAVTKRVLQQIGLKKGCRVLEPSAGTGNMVKKILETGASVDAVEISPDRVRVLNGINNPNLSVLEANFLQMKATPIYSHVVMNPPFAGTHYMEHVMHAFDFLAPGGTLVSVLPATAEIADSKKHKTFRKWAEKHTYHGTGFNSLPAESFASSGTRISTVLLTLHKPRY